MIIAEAESTDLQEILDLQKIAFHEAAVRYNDPNIQPMKQTLTELEKEFAEKLILKAEENSNIIGSVRAYTEDNVCYIGKLIVHPNHRDKGLGTKLMTEIEKRFHSVQRYELFTGQRDTKNICFYIRLGYAIFEEKKIKDNLILVFLEKMNREVQ
jgi:N-acetylglutamate synthase-like GNAT family acetyltransferase